MRHPRERDHGRRILTTGRGFFPPTAAAAPHDWLQNMGGSIGFSTPLSIGAAIACPDRKVITMVGDGSAMYTIQSLWTQARENLNIVTIVFANRIYQILRGEFDNVGAGEPGQRANDMLRSTVRRWTSSRWRRAWACPAAPSPMPKSSTRLWRKPSPSPGRG